MRLEQEAELAVLRMSHVVVAWLLDLAYWFSGPLASSIALSTCHTVPELGD